MTNDDIQIVLFIGLRVALAAISIQTGRSQKWPVWKTSILVVCSLFSWKAMAMCALLYAVIERRKEKEAQKQAAILAAQEPRPAGQPRPYWG